MGLGAWLDVSTEASVTCANGLSRRAENCKADASCNASENSELVSTCLRKADGTHRYLCSDNRAPGGTFHTSELRRCEALKGSGRS